MTGAKTFCAETSPHASKCNARVPSQYVDIWRAAFGDAANDMGRDSRCYIYWSCFHLEMAVWNPIRELITQGICRQSCSHAEICGDCSAGLKLCQTFFFFFPIFPFKFPRTQCCKSYIWTGKVQWLSAAIRVNWGWLMCSEITVPAFILSCTQYKESILHEGRSAWSAMWKSYCAL